ncbi:MAG: histidine kinase [Phycisphaerae bacterium]
MNRSTSASRVGTALKLGLGCLAACTLVGSLFAAQLSLFYLFVQGVELSWWKAARFTLPTWYAWGLLIPLIAYVATHWPPAWQWGRVGVHCAAATMLALVHVLLSATWLWAIERGTPEAQSWPKLLRFQLLVMFHIHILTYAGVVAGIAAWNYRRESRDRLLRAARLESQLSEARLSALRAQLRPHFLFNALNAITALIREDPATAERMIVAFSELLRSAIDERRDRVRLREELEFARRYLEIEQMRFGDRLQVRWRMDPGTLDQIVPHLLLQPLIENAVRHGLCAGTGPCDVEITSQRTNDRIELIVRDTGPGIPGNGPPREGVGLRATRARLAEMFGDAQTLTIANDAAGGCRAAIRFSPARGNGQEIA